MSDHLHVNELESRLTADEQRLSADEQRLLADEKRLLADEVRLEAEEAELTESRRVAWFGAGLALTLAVAVTALILGVIGLRDDVGALRESASEASVSTEALQDASVTGDKLAPGAVAASAVARGAIGPDKLVPGSVTGDHVARNALTGADIRESTLASVPLARDAKRLGGAPVSAFLARPIQVQAASYTSGRAIKGPVTARCPAGARVLSGGASIEGATIGAAIVRSAPDGEAWTATARVARRDAPVWRLVVTAVCSTQAR